MKLIPSFISSIFLLLFSLGSEASYAGSSIEREDGTAIDYYLDVASEKFSSNTLLVFFQGSDCNSVKHNDLIRQLSQVIWPSADLLLIEKPGITSSLPFDSDPERPDCPDFYIENDSPEQRAKDANAVLDNVAKDDQYKTVIALGGSEGAVATALLAANYSVVDAIVMINGGGRWFLDDVIHNIKSTSPESELTSVLEGFKGFAEKIVNSEPFDVEASNHGYAWWRSALTIDQKSVLNRVNVPALVIQGGRDQSVSPEAVRELIEDLHSIGKNNIELMTYPEMEHDLSDPGGQRMTQEIAEYISEWLKAKLEPSPNKHMHWAPMM